MKVGVLWPHGMMSSVREDWATPVRLFRLLNDEFGFTLDVCAVPDTAVVPNYFTSEQDGLLQDWTGICWMNPPYGRKIYDWIQKAYESSKRGATVVCLLPSRTDTQWWHKFCMKGEIRFLEGRLEFDDKKGGRCPFPSAIVIFRPKSEATT